MYDSVQSFLPKIFRKPIDDMNSSFFNLSCYPISTKNFNIDKVLYTDYPSGLLGLLKTGWEISGLSGFVKAMRSARPKRIIRDMKANHISKAVVLQLNTPAVDCMEDMKNITNKYEELLTFGSIDPLDDDFDEKIQLNIKSGVKGWKIAPHVNGNNIDSENSIRLLKALHKTNMPIITCSGLAFPENKLHLVPRPLRKEIETQNIDRFKTVLKEIPNINLIFAHSGLYQYKKLIKLMKEYPNIYADISTQPASNIKELIEEVGSERLLFGTDYPAFNHAITILSVLRATKNEQARINIFSNNAKKILNIN